MRMPLVTCGLAAGLVGCGDNWTRTPPRDSPPASDAQLEDAAADAGLDAMTATACSGDRFPMNVGDPVQCCQLGDRTWHIVGGTGPNAGKLAQRVYASPCRQADGVSTDCSIGSSTGTKCVFGPCGAKTEWTIGPATPSYIFAPVSAPGTCGWEAGTDMYSPELYTNQTLYPGVVPTCPYLDCLADGTPVITGYALSITAVENSATGMIASSPVGISLGGAGTTQWGYVGGTAVTVTATPMGTHARAVLGNACTVTGDYGVAASCTVTMDATKTVAVSYECESTFVCL